MQYIINYIINKLNILSKECFDNLINVTFDNEINVPFLK